MFDTTNRSRRCLCRAAACGVALLWGCSSSEPPVSAPTIRTAAAARDGAAPAQQYIKVQAVRADDQGLGGTLPGRLAFRPGALAAVGTPFAGRVLSVEVRPGQAVRAGAPLVVLQSSDAADARSALVQAQARLAVAQDLLRRQDDMLARGVGLEVERFAAHAGLQEAQSEVGRARQKAAMAGQGAGDRLVLRAPNPGVVLEIRARAGAVVEPGAEALVEVGDPAQLWVVADVPERELGSLAVGRGAQVSVPGIDASFAATIDSIGHAVDAEQRRMPIYLSLAQAGAGNTAAGELTAGMLAQVRLHGARQARLTLPASAVLIKNGTERQVYLQGEDGSYAPRPVRTGASRNGRVEILEGLTEGEQVVVEGALLLDNDARQLL